MIGRVHVSRCLVAAAGVLATVVACFTAATHRSDALTHLSLMIVSFMFSAVTHFGVSSTD